MSGLFEISKILQTFESCTKSFFYEWHFSNTGTKLQEGRTGESPAVISVLDIDLVHSDPSLFISPNQSTMCTKNDESIKEIPLTRGLKTIVDAEDYEYLSKWKWYAAVDRSGKFYAKHTDQTGTQIWMHRLIMQTPDNLRVDHIDRDTLNNRKSNLRNCTKKQNNSYRSKNRNSRFPYKGICFYKHRSAAFEAQIRVDGKLYHLGHYHTIEEAAKAYDRAALEHFKDFALLNFPETKNSSL